MPNSTPGAGVTPVRVKLPTVTPRRERYLALPGHLPQADGVLHRLAPARAALRSPRTATRWRLLQPEVGRLRLPGPCRPPRRSLSDAPLDSRRRDPTRRTRPSQREEQAPPGHTIGILLDRYPAKSSPSMTGRISGSESRSEMAMSAALIPEKFPHTLSLCIEHLGNHFSPRQRDAPTPSRPLDNLSWLQLLECSGDRDHRLLNQLGQSSHSNRLAHFEQAT